MKQILLAFALCFTTIAFAQNSNLNAGKTAINEGNYAEAYKKLKAASEHKKTMNNPEVWSYLGLVYAGLQSFPSEAISALGFEEITDDMILSTVDKAASLDGENKFADKLNEVKQGLVNNANNAAVAAYQNQDFAQSAAEFERKVTLSEKLGIPVNATDLINIGSLYSNNLNMPEKGIGYFEKATEIGVVDPAVFHSILNYHREDNPKAYLSTLKKAQETFPDENNFKLLEIQMYIDNGTIEEKIDELIAVANENPTDANMAIVVSEVFMQQENYEKQYAWLEKALQADPENFTATLNSGIALFNQSVEFHNIMNNAMSYDAPEYKDAKVKRDALAQKALPYLDKAFQMNTASKTAQQALWQYHTMMGNNDEAAKYEALYDQE